MLNVRAYKFSWFPTNTKYFEQGVQFYCACLTDYMCLITVHCIEKLTKYLRAFVKGLHVAVCEMSGS